MARYVYRAEEVDVLIASLEKGAAKIEATKESKIKTRAAERDIMGLAEKTRDLLMKACKGDKNFLSEVFAADRCARLHRLMHINETTEFTDIGVGDERWGHLKENIITVKKILEDMGTYKPPRPPNAAPPTKLSYSGIRRRCSPGRKLKYKPDIDVPDCDFFVEGELPSGLVLKSDGTLEGKIDSEITDINFVVVAKNNDTDRVEFLVQFSCTQPPPSDLSYNGLSGYITCGETHAYQATVGSGSNYTFKIEPALPEGLVFDSESGAITGAVETPCDAKDYVVTCTNIGGSTTCTINFGAQMEPPSELSYEQVNGLGATLGRQPTFSPTSMPSMKGIKLTKGMACQFVPTLESGVATLFTVDKALPDGLSLDEKTGEIRGKPEHTTEMTDYTITAENAGGKTTATLTLGVRLDPPSSVAYLELQEQYTDAGIVHLIPTIGEDGGAAAEFVVEPALPQGLALSAATGEISGIPRQLGKDKYVITASNAAGSTTTEIELNIVRAPPKDLVYPALTDTYGTEREMKIHPTYIGEVDTFAVSPALPDGLLMDAKTGTISGAPTAVTEQTTYTVTATNETGSVKCEVSFATQVLPPSNLKYPHAEDEWDVGAPVQAEPEFIGSRVVFTVEPPLPEGVVLDSATGVISGAPTDEEAWQTYIINATNESGSVEFKMELKVAPAPPSNLNYPTLGDSLIMDEEVNEAPTINPGNYRFKVSPDLPEGMSLHPETGVISGTPTDECDEAKYTITASNVKGECSKEIRFSVVEGGSMAISEKVAREIEECDTVEALLAKEPNKNLKFADWMVWMVHRAHMNDPTLTELNFNNMAMPLPHLEWRVAPKLMKALETNTNLQVLALSNSNMHKPQGPELAKALEVNTTLSIINIETNHLDAQCLIDIANGIKNNPNTNLDQVRIANQTGLGGSYGRAVELAWGEMLRENKTICRLGFSAEDAHWRDVISKSLLRNGDLARIKRRKGDAAVDEMAELVPEEFGLSRISLLSAPESPASSVFGDGAAIGPFKTYLITNGRLPTPTQLQAAAKSHGISLKFSELKPALEEGRRKLLDGAKDTEIEVVDNLERKHVGKFYKWENKGSTWTIEVITDDMKKMRCSGQKEPPISLSADFSGWLQA